MATPGTVIALVSPDELVERVANGEIPSRIATELGVTKAAVYYHLFDHPKYQPARKSGMAIRLDDAESAIIDSTDQLTLSRAREAFRAVAWRAEREHPELWGATNKVTGADGGPLQVRIVRYGDTIEGKATRADELTPLIVPSTPSGQADKLK